MDEDNEMIDICDKLKELHDNLENSLKILKNLLADCQHRENVCPYCLQNLSDGDHLDTCDIKIMIKRLEGMK
jgi:hypothetical protein